MLVKLRFFILLYISNSYLEVTILPIGAFLWGWIFVVLLQPKTRISITNKNIRTK